MSVSHHCYTELLLAGRVQSLFPFQPLFIFLKKQRGRLNPAEVLFLSECNLSVSSSLCLGALTPVPWRKKKVFFLFSKGSMFVFLLNQNDKNPSKNLQLNLYMMLLMDRNGFRDRIRVKKEFLFANIQRPNKVMWLLYFLSLQWLLHS